MNLNCRCVLKYYVLVYSGLCWVLNKICRFKCGNNTKSETASKKKQRIRPRFIPEPKQKAYFWPRVQPKPRPKRVSNLKKKKRSPYDLGWHRKPRPKGRALWPRVPLNRGRRGLYGFGS